MRRGAYLLAASLAEPAKTCVVSVSAPRSNSLSAGVPTHERGGLNMVIVTAVGVAGATLPLFPTPSEQNPSAHARDRRSQIKFETNRRVNLSCFKMKLRVCSGLVRLTERVAEKAVRYLSRR